MARPRICRRRPVTIPSNKGGTPWNCCETHRWTWDSASSARRPVTIKKKTASSTGNLREPTHAYLRLHDEVRWMRTLRRHLSLGHHAHRRDLSPRLQHRTEHVLGVLLLREGLSPARDRR